MNDFIIYHWWPIKNIFNKIQNANSVEIGDVSPPTELHFERSIFSIIFLPITIVLNGIGYSASGTKYL